MSPRPDAARLEFILEMISDIEDITRRHNGIRPAMSDKEGYHALMMCCLQIGEALGKIDSSSYKDNLPVRMAQYLRNLIAHDYLGISLDRMISTLETSIPELKIKIEKLVKESPEI
jgi:uncharacterized protein with HEPN domain